MLLLPCSALSVNRSTALFLLAAATHLDTAQRNMCTPEIRQKPLTSVREGKEKKIETNKQIKKTDLHMWEERNILYRLPENQDRRGKK